MSDCARDPRVAPYNVVAETGTTDYLLKSARIQLADDKISVANLKGVISDLGLALMKATGTA